MSCLGDCYILHAEDTVAKGNDSGYVGPELGDGEG